MKILSLILALVSFDTSFLHAADTNSRWSEKRANTWYAGKPWMVGCNFSPSTAINQLEMWQADTFDEATIDRELGYAESLGFTSVRVFLHDLLWKQDSKGFIRRVDRFLQLADQHHIGALVVLFDSCWYPLPKLGPQPAPIQFTHNSGWVQSPGVEVLEHPEQQGYLKEYVLGMIGHFARDRRINGWDVWNEPDNWDGGAPKRPGLEPTNKVELVVALLPKVFAWAHSAKPSQPVTSGVWRGTWNHMNALSPTERIQLENSDVISFHCYGGAEELAKAMSALKRLNRPVWCTEFMARPAGSTFAPHLGMMKQQRVAAYCWGFVSGKTQTIFPWDSWTKKYTAEPTLWFHDIFRANGTPFDPKEVAFIRHIALPQPAAVENGTEALHEEPVNR
jgi:hypothetical protein